MGFHVGSSHSLGPWLWMVALPWSVLAANSGLESSTNLKRIFCNCSSRSLIKTPSRRGPRRVSRGAVKKSDFRLQHKPFTSALLMGGYSSSPVCLFSHPDTYAMFQLCPNSDVAGQTTERLRRVDDIHCPSLIHRSLSLLCNKYHPFILLEKIKNER